MNLKLFVKVVKKSKSLLSSFGLQLPTLDTIVGYVCAIPTQPCVVVSVFTSGLFEWGEVIRGF
jgi:hypothetical protein